jgi:hypothetical protein
VNRIDPVNNEILGWIRAFADKAKPFAEDPAHHLQLGEPRQKYSEHLRLPTRLANWDSEIVYWYYVQYAQDGRRYRVLAIHMSQYCHHQDPDKAATEAALARQHMSTSESKRLWVDYWTGTGVVAIFFPFHTSVGFQLVTTEPRLVRGKREGLASFRFGIEWSILVPDETAAGVGGAHSDARAASPLVDQHGNPIAKPIENVAMKEQEARRHHVATRDTGPEQHHNGADQVIPFAGSRAERRRAERAAKRDAKKNQ